jgi:hypothetical protein
MMLLDINLQMIERSADYEPNDKPNDKRGTIGSPEERQNKKRDLTILNIIQRRLQVFSALYVGSNSVQMKRELSI